jgi:hypothetical protein
MSKSSTWYITINPNIAVFSKTEAQHKKENLKQIVSEIFEQNLKDFVICDDEFTPQYIKDIDLQCAIEVGEKYHRIHCHLILSINHNTNLKLDYSKLRGSLKSKFYGKDSNKNVHLFCKTVHPDRANIQKYIQKTKTKI